LRYHSANNIKIQQLLEDVQFKVDDVNSLRKKDQMGYVVIEGNLIGCFREVITIADIYIWLDTEWNEASQRVAKRRGEHKRHLDDLGLQARKRQKVVDMNHAVTYKVVQTKWDDCVVMPTLFGSDRISIDAIVHDIMGRVYRLLNDDGSTNPFDDAPRTPTRSPCPMAKPKALPKRPPPVYSGEAVMQATSPQGTVVADAIVAYDMMVHLRSSPPLPLRTKAPPPVFVGAAAEWVDYSDSQRAASSSHDNFHAGSSVIAPQQSASSRANPTAPWSGLWAVTQATSAQPKAESSVATNVRGAYLAGAMVPPMPLRSAPPPRLVESSVAAAAAALPAPPWHTSYLPDEIHAQIGTHYTHRGLPIDKHREVWLSKE
jgi:cytidylate kinase